MSYSCYWPGNSLDGGIYYTTDCIISGILDLMQYAKRTTYVCEWMCSYMFLLHYVYIYIFQFMYVCGYIYIYVYVKRYISKY